MHDRGLQLCVDKRSRVKRPLRSTACGRDSMGPTGYRLFGTGEDEGEALRLQTKREASNYSMTTSRSIEALQSSGMLL